MSNRNKRISIIITKEYTIKCSLFDSNIDIENQKEIPVEIINGKQEYPITILFNQNEIKCCENNIIPEKWIIELFENPKIFTKTTFNYQGKEYSVIPEVYLALILKVEKEYIIDQTIVTLPSDNYYLIQRIKVALKSIGFENIIINSFSFDYAEQGDILQEVIKKKDKYEKFSNTLQKAKELSNSDLDLLTFSNDQPFNEKSLYTIGLHFTTKQKERMKLYTLDNYCVFIASRHFTSLQDFINLEFVCKRFRGNMEKFHYNPISVTDQTIKYFPNTETLNLYTPEDQYILRNRITAFWDWNKIGVFESKNKSNGYPTIYKRLTFTQKDRDLLHSNGLQQFRNDQMSKYHRFGINAIEDDSHYKHEFILHSDIRTIDDECFKCFSLKKISIPTTVTSLGAYCFSQCDLKEIEIPESINSIGMNCFFGCTSLMKLTFLSGILQSYQHYSFMDFSSVTELHVPREWKLEGDRLFRINLGRLQSIELPSSIKSVNSLPTSELLSYHIPSFVTKLNDYCFANCQKLEQISNLEQIKSFGKGCFMNCPLLHKHQSSFLLENIRNQCNLTDSQITQLEEWTSLKLTDVIFDSDIDNWSKHSSVFNDRIIKKSHLLFLLEDENKEKFGYYLHSEILERISINLPADYKSFHFNLNVTNPLSSPIKCNQLSIEKGYCLHHNSTIGLIELGDFILYKNNINMKSCINYSDDHFNYPINHSLFYHSNQFSVHRILVLQFN